MLRYLYQIAKKILLIEIRKGIVANVLEGNCGINSRSAKYKVPAAWKTEKSTEQNQLKV